MSALSCLAAMLRLSVAVFCASASCAVATASWDRTADSAFKLSPRIQGGGRRVRVVADGGRERESAKRDVVQGATFLGKARQGGKGVSPKFVFVRRGKKKGDVVSKAKSQCCTQEGRLTLQP